MKKDLSPKYNLFMYMFINNYFEKTLLLLEKEVVFTRKKGCI